MGKGLHCSDIKESADELMLLERSTSQGLNRDRVRFIRIIKEVEGISIAAASKQTGGYKKSWGYNISHLYQQKGLDAILDYPFKGSRPRLDDQRLQQVVAKLSEDGTATLAQGAKLIEQTTGVHYGISGVWYVFRRMGIRKKTGRPSNVRKDEAGAEEFKKKPRP